MPLGDNFNWSGAAQYLGLDPSWYEDDSQLRDDIQAKWDAATPAQRQNFSRNLANQPRQRAAQAGSAPSRPQGVANMFNDHGDAFAYGGFNSAMMGARGQNNALQGMAGDVMQAFQNENESRVAQAREMRRMEHEREMERMRQETEQQKTAALLKRLDETRRASMMTPYGPVLQFRNGEPM